MKKILLILLVGFSAQVMTSDRASMCHETITLRDIVAEKGAATTFNLTQQSITLKYEDVVRHEQIVFRDNSEKALQVIQAKELFRKELRDVLNAIKVETEQHSPSIIDWVPLVKFCYLGRQGRYQGYFGGCQDASFFACNNLDHAIFKAKKEFRNWVISEERNHE